MSQEKPAEKPIKSGNESQEGVKIVVHKVYQFTHPEYDARVRPTSKRKEELQKLWAEKIEQIAKEDDSLLFYVAVSRPWEYRELAKAKKGDDKYFRQFRERYEPMLERDLKRIKESKLKLGIRFIIVFESMDSPVGHVPKKETVEEVLKRKGIEVDKDNLTFECFGEYAVKKDEGAFSGCVPFQAKLLKKALGMANPDEIDQSEINTYLSLDVKDG